MNNKIIYALLATSLTLAATQTQAACKDITYAQLQSAANNALASNSTGGLKLNMWATFVDETGKVCAVVNTGAKGSLAGNSEWLGSRVISAQKANTANAFSLDGLSISSGALYAAVQPVAVCMACKKAILLMQRPLMQATQIITAKRMTR